MRIKVSQNCLVIFSVSLAVLTGCATIQSAYVTKSLPQRIEATQLKWRTSGTGFALADVPASEAQASPELQTVLDRIVYASPLRGYPIHAFLYNDETLNAFSNGRDIYVNLGMVKKFQNSPLVLVGVMAHELGHVIGNHVKSGFTRSAVEQVAALLSQKTSQNAQAVLGQVFALTSAGYSRHEEKEADVIGAVLAHSAGFDSSGLIQYFELSKTMQQADTAAYSKALAPHLSAFQEAQKQYQTHWARRQNAANAQQAVQWAQIAKQQQDSIKQVINQYQTHLNATDTLYRSHPPDEDRAKSIALVRARILGQITDQDMMASDADTFQIYQAIQAARPKN